MARTKHTKRNLDDIVNDYNTNEYDHGLKEEDKIKEGDLHDFVLPEPDDEIRKTINGFEKKVQETHEKISEKVKNISRVNMKESFLPLIISVSFMLIISIILFTKLQLLQKDINLLYDEQQKTHMILSQIETFIENPSTPAVFIDVESFRKSFITKILADDKNKTKTKTKKD